MPHSAIGSFTFVLHSHLPYVLSHGRWPHGTDWIHEATLNCYLPLIQMLSKLQQNGKKAGITLGVTPVLAEQLADPAFKAEFSEYLTMRIKYARENLAEFESQGQRRMAGLARYWLNLYTQMSGFFHEDLNRDMIGAIRGLCDQKMTEIITCGATHGYFPLLSTDASLRLQIAQALRTHERHFGQKPKGIWLPECAYRPGYEWKRPLGEAKAALRPGVEEILAEFGIRYFITDSHMLKGGKAIGTYLDRFGALKRLWERYETEAPDSGEEEARSTLEAYWVASGPDQEQAAAVFTRDPETALTVWSAEAGYPGDGWYLDFHKKHFPGGLKYWRVTQVKSDLAEKEIYEPEMVEARLDENARHFTDLVITRLTGYYKATGRPGHLTAPFDTELFGHWWFEGPRFLEKVLTRLTNTPQVELVPCGEQLDRRPPQRVISLPEGSWGQGGFHWVWFNKDTTWTWPHIYECEDILAGLLKNAPSPQGTLKRILKQAARELLLLQASDWQFLISTWSARDYAEMRFSEHVEAFKKLAKTAEKIIIGGQANQADLNQLDSLEQRDHLFSDIDPADFR